MKWTERGGFNKVWSEDETPYGIYDVVWHNSCVYHSLQNNNVEEPSESSKSWYCSGCLEVIIK